MSSNIENIFISDGCLSESAIFRYLENALSEDELISVGKHLSECEMCSDALDGYKLMPDEAKTAKMIRMIKEEISSDKAIFTINKNNTIYHRFFAYAATLILICGTALILYNYLKKHENTDISKLIIEKQTKDTLSKMAQLNNEKQPHTGSGLIAIMDKTSKKNINTIGKSGFKYDNGPLIVKEEDIYVIDKTIALDQSHANRIISDGEVEQKIPLQPYDTKTISDSDKSKKNEDKPSVILVGGTFKDENQEIVVVTAQENSKTNSSKFRNERVPSSPNKNNDLNASGGDEIGLKSDIKVQEDVLEEYAEILKRDTAGYSSLYYLGVSFFNLKKYKNCIKQLDKIIEFKDAEFYEDALWYKAQSLIAIKENGKAKYILDQIINDGKKYNKQAKKKRAKIK